MEKYKGSYSNRKLSKGKKDEENTKREGLILERSGQWCSKWLYVGTIYVAGIHK